MVRESSKRTSSNASGMNTACDFWAVLQANSARKATQIQRFPRSTESEPHNTRGKPPKSPEPWQYQDPFPAEPSRSRGTWTHANKEALRRTLIPLHSASASANRGAERRSKWMLLRPLFTKRHSHWHLRNYPDRLSGHVSIISNTRYIYNAQQSPASPAMRVIAHITVAGNHLSSRSPSFWNSRLLLTAIAAVIASRIQSGYSDRTAGAYVAICAAMISTVSTRSSSQSPDIAASAAFRPKILCRRGEQGLEACSHGHVAALRQHHRVVICFEVGEGHKDAIRLARDGHFIH